MPKRNLHSKEIYKQLYKEMGRILRAFFYAFEGVKSAWRSEVAFRLELLAVVLAIPLALFITQEKSARAVLVASVILVLIVEIINTAIETIINRISSEIHPLSKLAKDLASGAVLLAIINAVIVWAVVLWP